MLEREMDYPKEFPQTQADLHHLIDTLLGMAAQDVSKAPVCRELVLKLEAHLVPTLEHQQAGAAGTARLVPWLPIRSNHQMKPDTILAVDPEPACPGAAGTGRASASRR